MMSDLGKGTSEFQFWADLFNFRKAFHDAPKGNGKEVEKFWGDLIKATGELKAKYENADFNEHGIVTKQILILVADLEAQAKDEAKEDETDTDNEETEDILVFPNAV